MKKLLFAALTVLAISTPVFADDMTSNKLLGYKVAATDANSTVTPTIGVGGATSITIYNADSTNEIFVAVDAVATDASVEIPAGASLSLENFEAKTLGIICTGGETATVYVYVTLR